MKGSSPELFFVNFLLIAAFFITTALTVTYKLIPYFFFYKTAHSGFFLASNYEGPPNVDATNKTEAQINRERRALIPGKLLSPDFDRNNVIILEKPSPISPQFGEATVDLVEYKPERISFKTNSSQPKILFLADIFYFGWKVKVDGQYTEIFRANYMYRAVPLIGGKHTVIFYYDNALFLIGVFVSACLLAILALFNLREKGSLVC